MGVGSATTIESYMQGNEVQTPAELYHEALSANPIEAQAAILSLQQMAKEGSVEAEAALQALVPVLQHRVELGYPDALQHLEQIAQGSDSANFQTESSVAASAAIQNLETQAENVVVQSLVHIVETSDDPEAIQAAINQLEALALSGNENAMSALENMVTQMGPNERPTEVALMAAIAIGHIRTAQSP